MKLPNFYNRINGELSKIEYDFGKLTDLKKSIKEDLLLYYYFSMKKNSERFR